MAVNFRGKLDAVHRVDQVHILDDVLHFIGLQVSDKVYLCILGIEILFGQVFLHPVFSQGMNAAAYGVVDCLRCNGFRHRHQCNVIRRLAVFRFCLLHCIDDPLVVFVDISKVSFHLHQSLLQLWNHKALNNHRLR